MRPHLCEGADESQAHQSILALLDGLPQESVAGKVAVAEVELHLAKDKFSLGFVEGSGGGVGCHGWRLGRTEAVLGF